MKLIAPFYEDDRQRRVDARSKGFNGIDYLEIGADPRKLKVFFFLPAPADLQAANCTIEGGARIKGIRVVAVREPDDDPGPGAQCVTLTVDRPGDFSVYTLELAGLAGFDPHYTRCAFSFKVAEPKELDCASGAGQATDVWQAPEIDYLSKDYVSFRQLLVNRLALTMPAWSETHEPDEGVALIELLAYVGDYLSYYQDAVATEAYLNTARQRISVRRHARLVDYAVHEGCNARTWICIDTDTDILSLSPHACCFVTDCHNALPDPSAVLGPAALQNVPVDQYQVFSATATASLDIHAAHSYISFYAWGARQYVLPEGATAATLLDEWVEPAAGVPASSRVRSLASLQVGSFMLIEEVCSPLTGLAADADPAHRQVVRLTRVKPGVDPLYDLPVVEVEWAPADALQFALVVSIIGPAPDCAYIGPLAGAEAPRDVMVARANVWLADHGAQIEETWADSVPVVTTVQDCEAENQPAQVLSVAGAFAPALQHTDLVFAAPVATDAHAASLLEQDSRAAQPQLLLDSIPGVSDGSGPLFTFDALNVPDGLIARLKTRDPATDGVFDRLPRAARAALADYDGRTPPPVDLVKTIETQLAAFVIHWNVQADLLSSGPDDHDCVIEIDNDRVAHLRFGDGQSGAQPAAGSIFRARYRSGIALAGNIGAGTLIHLQMLSGVLSGGIRRVWNPLPAQGGVAPEALLDVQMNAPTAFLATIERAITADDYVTLAERFPGVRRAAASLRWMGSRYAVKVAVAPYGGEQVSRALLEQVAVFLERYRRIGHDVEVTPASYVPLDIRIEVHVDADYLRGHVEAALLATFGAGPGRGAAQGLLAPDNVSFGEDLYLSALTAAAQAVEGVTSVRVTRFERMFIPSNDALVSGVLTLGPQEIARVDNDPNFPEHGRLRFEMRGGR